MRQVKQSLDTAPYADDFDILHHHDCDSSLIIRPVASGYRLRQASATPGAPFDGLPPPHHSARLRSKTVLDWTCECLEAFSHALAAPELAIGLRSIWRMTSVTPVTYHVPSTHSYLGLKSAVAAFVSLAEGSRYLIRHSFNSVYLDCQPREEFTSPYRMPSHKSQKTTKSVSVKTTKVGWERMSKTTETVSVKTTKYVADKKLAYAIEPPKKQIHIRRIEYRV